MDIPKRLILWSVSGSAYGIINRFLHLIRGKIRTINGLERINKELKRRTRVVGAFPSDQSFMRLGVSILIDINEEWMTNKKYLSMDMMIADS